MRAKPVFLCFFVGACAAVLALSACGAGTDVHEPLSQVPWEIRKDLPIPETFARWQEDWDGKSWIVAHQEGSARRVEKEPFKAALALEVARWTHPAWTAAAQQALALSLAGRMGMQRLTHPALRGDGKPGFRQFSALRIDPQALSPDFTSRMLTLPGSEPTKLRVLREVGRLIEAQPGVSYAEPDVMSWPLEGKPAVPRAALDYKLPDEFTSGNGSGDTMVKVLQRIHADRAYQAIGQNPDVNDRLQVIVAVIDTGVDYNHPDLAAQMNRNGGEDGKDATKDNDGNGAAGDVFGIDASIDPEVPDTIPASTRPGAADIGGPGVACPNSSGATATTQNPDEDNGEQKPTKRAEQCGHGTHVAGIIAAQHGGDLKTLGVCGSCRIMSIRASGLVKNENGSYGNGGIGDAAQLRGLDYILRYNARRQAREQVRLVNMSIGKYLRSRAMGETVRKVDAAGIQILAAAGNNDVESPMYPAGYGSVMAVCATSNSSGRGDYAKASFSNFGDWVDICAPGSNILSTVPGGTAEEKSGTSQATPVVTGALGYLMSIDYGARGGPFDTPQEAARILRTFSNDKLLYEDPKNKDYVREFTQLKLYMLGFGFLDLERAVTYSSQRASEVAVNSTTGAYNQVPKGCIASSVPGAGRWSWNALSSMPFLLIQGWICLRLARRAGRLSRSAGLAGRKPSRGRV